MHIYIFLIQNCYYSFDGILCWRCWGTFFLRTCWWDKRAVALSLICLQTSWLSDWCSYSNVSAVEGSSSSFACGLKYIERFMFFMFLLLNWIVIIELRLNWIIAACDINAIVAVIFATVGCSSIIIVYRKVFGML